MAARKNLGDALENVYRYSSNSNKNGRSYIKSFSIAEEIFKRLQPISQVIVNYSINIAKKNIDASILVMCFVQIILNVCSNCTIRIAESGNSLIILRF